MRGGVGQAPMHQKLCVRQGVSTTGMPQRCVGNRASGHVLGGSSCMVKNEGKGRKMTGFQRHQKIVVLMDILKPSQTSMAE